MPLSADPSRKKPVAAPLTEAEVPRRRATPPPRPPEAKSAVHFDVYPQMNELLAFASEQGWFALGWTELTVVSVELFFSTDGWKTTHCVRSFDGSACVQGNRIVLAGVPPRTPVSFALRLGVAAHAPGDVGGFRARGLLWLNNGWDEGLGRFRNYDQVTTE